jgi:alpha-beta hydrolase superfamily lysophospholipase
MKPPLLLRTAFLAGLLWPCLALAEEAKVPTRAETFEVAGHTAHLYAAPQPAEGKPWLWYAPTINGVSLAGRRVYFEGLLKAGVSIAGYDLGEVRGAPGSSAQFTLFYEEMVRRGFDRRPVLLGQSRGGLMMLSWAFRNPQKVRAFVGIYPVCNLLDWPMKNKAVTLADYGLSEEELRRDVARYNPLDNLKPLLDHKVPMFVIHGDSDKTVPYDENTRLLKERYEAGGGKITVKVIPGKGHEAVPEFFEDHDLLAFVLQAVRK